MNRWDAPAIEELDIMHTYGGTQNGTEKNGKGNQYNGGMTEPDPTPTEEQPDPTDPVTPSGAF